LSIEVLVFYSCYFVLSYFYNYYSCCVVTRDDVSQLTMMMDSMINDSRDYYSIPTVCRQTCGVYVLPRGEIK
ncbi:MAG: hypothetical protein ACI8RD_003894, partial [Bacillariaceae sp.]